MSSDRQGFNRRWFAPNLEAVFTPTPSDDVASTVGEALATYGSGVKVTSGRHGYENFVYNDQTRAVIDLSALNRAGFDRDRNAFFVEAGCENWTAYRTLLNGYGRTLPAGSCYSVGAGGHISGGGYGLLSRLHGLTIDHLTAADVVTWDAATSRATLRHVSAGSTDAAERDLFWALTGAGGGNFGVITRFYFADLPEAPDRATLWTLAWDWADLDLRGFARLLAEYADMVEGMPEGNFSLLKLNHVASGQLGMTMQLTSPAGTSLGEHVGAAEGAVEHARMRFAQVARPVPLVRPLAGHPAFMSTAPTSQSAQHLTYLEALQTLNGSGPNQFGKYKSAYMAKPFPPEQVEAIFDALHQVPDGLTPLDMTQSLLQVDSYGGAVNRRAPDATAVPQRSSLLKLQYQTYWNNDSEPGRASELPYRQQSEAHLAWINDFYRAVYADCGGTPDPARDPSGTVQGCYVNYPDCDLGAHETGDAEHALWLYFLDNLRNNARNLVGVKQRWDPTNVFRNAQSIPVE